MGSNRFIVRFSYKGRQVFGLIILLAALAVVPAPSRSARPRFSRRQIIHQSSDNSQLRAHLNRPFNFHMLFGPQDGETLEAAALARQSAATVAEMHKSLFDYSYILKKIKRVLTESGKVSHEQVQVFEAYPVRGSHALVQLSNNGKRLDSSEITEERIRVGKELEKAEREEMQRSNGGRTTADPHRQVTAGIYGTYHGKHGAIVIDLSEFLRSCEFSSPRRERFNGRDTIILNFRPKADINFSLAKAFMKKLVGVVWIDSIDRVVVRLEAWPAPEFTNERGPQYASRPKASLIYQQVRLPAGIWFPSLIRMNSAGDGSIFNGLNWDVVFEFSDYKRFSTEVKDVRLDPPQNRH